MNGAMSSSKQRNRRKNMEWLDFSQYTWWIAAVQMVVAIIMFYVTNWLGGHTPMDRGYVTLSLIAADDTMPAFNFVFKILTPLVQYIFVIALFQNITLLSIFLVNSYMIIVYYWLCRGGYYIARGAFYLANWPIFLLYTIVSVGIAVWIYGFVESLGSILPSKEALRDQLWILIAIFVYQVVNNLTIDREGTEDRKKRYALRKYHEFKRKYANVVDANCAYVVDADLLHAIMIVENYNRPPIVRMVENLKFRLTHKRMTLGIMQVMTDEMIDDKESIIRAAKIIAKLRKDYMKRLKEDNEDRSSIALSAYVYHIAEKYNGGDDQYADEVRAIFEMTNSLQIEDVYDVKQEDVVMQKLPEWRKKK